MATVHRLSDRGRRALEDYLRAGAQGSSPLGLAESSPVRPEILIEPQQFRTRFDFGQYLQETLSPLRRAAIAHDAGLWDWLALYYLDQLCPLRRGSRRIRGLERYVLSRDFRKYYRHLVASSYVLHDLHGESARLLLHSPLDVHPDVIEQLASRQAVISNRALIRAAYQLYFDPAVDGGRPRRGITDRDQPGTLRRLVVVVDQLELTHDLQAMDGDAILALLPEEFDPWKPAHLRS